MLYSGLYVAYSETRYVTFKGLSYWDDRLDSHLGTVRKYHRSIEHPPALSPYTISIIHDQLGLTGGAYSEWLYMGFFSMALICGGLVTL